MIPLNLLLRLGVKLIKHEYILMGEVGFILIKYISVSPFILLAHFLKNMLLNLDQLLNMR